MIDKFYSIIKNKDVEADFRLSEGVSTSISLKDGEITANSSKNFGYSIRVYKNGAFGFSSSNNPEDLQKVIENAIDLAKVKDGKIKMAPKIIKSGKFEFKTKKNPLDISIEEKINWLKNLNKSIASENISNTSLNYFEIIRKYNFVDSFGANITQFEPIVFLSVSVVAKSGKEQNMGYESVGGMGGFEVLKDADEKAKNAVKKAKILFNASFPPAGVFKVIIDPIMAGLFAHEALGHACEADIINSDGSVLKNKLGSKIASEKVTIFDDATVKGAFGSYFADEEGVFAKKRTLVQNGYLKSFMGSRETFEYADPGNARAQDYSHMPIVRMSNTFFSNGDAKLGDLFELKKGIYAIGGKGGEVNTKTGEFMFSADYGYLVENGEKTKILKNITLSGNILETLNTVDLVSNEKITLTPGICGKEGQEVRATTGGAHLRLECMVGGQ